MFTFLQKSLREWGMKFGTVAFPCCILSGQTSCGCVFLLPPSLVRQCIHEPSRRAGRVANMGPHRTFWKVESAPVGI